jgi:hypothetical protein
MVAITARLSVILFGLFLVDAVWPWLVEHARRRRPPVSASKD